MPSKADTRLKFSRELISMTWDPRNLYQLSRKKLFTLKQRTRFQHMWKAKRDTRGYHDANITERQWLRMFKPQLPTLSMKLNDKSSHPNTASLMYACMERRMDFIVFRSHFASSIWMARQLIVHGKVKLNGQKHTFPSHTVSDGDIVSVEPDSVVTLKPNNDSKELRFSALPFQQPWMFIPEYLEVNYNTCSTVFLREPVTRPSTTEVPSPYPPEFHSLAFEYYIRRGRTRK
ncbi:hypothetical protein GGI04_001863 [Coemansia thaxteri]|nr:hypothetical protein GGI04_001863 [Coemansia thaxteri]KAJ2463512.1 hypothetical protein GGI02_005224 [Coemansia sp. RSA 2322]